MAETFAAVLLVVCCLIAVLVTALRLPGTWVIVASALGYGWWNDWQVIGAVTVGVLIGIALLGEVVELTASVLTARKAGASRQAAWGGLIGGIVGMLFLSFLATVPVPVIGTLVGAMVGALIGCFGGAMIAELAVRRKLAQGTKVGLFSALGFVLGTVAKMALAMVMSGILLTSVLLA